MKRLMLTMAIMAMGTLSAFAQNTLTKEYDFGKITKIEASSIFDIEVTQGNTKKVTVVYDEVFKDRLEITGILGKLELNLSQAPFKRDNSKKNAGIKVYLQMPTIEEISPYVMRSEKRYAVDYNGKKLFQNPNQDNFCATLAELDIE